MRPPAVEMQNSLRHDYLLTAHHWNRSRTRTPYVALPVGAADRHLPPIPRTLPSPHHYFDGAVIVARYSRRLSQRESCGTADSGSWTTLDRACRPDRARPSRPVTTPRRGPQLEIGGGSLRRDLDTIGAVCHRLEIYSTRFLSDLKMHLRAGILLLENRSEFEPGVGGKLVTLAQTIPDLLRNHLAKAVGNPSPLLPLG